MKRKVFGMAVVAVLGLAACQKETINPSKEPYFDPNAQFASTTYDWSSATDWQVFTDQNVTRRFRINVIGNSNSTALTSCDVNYSVGIEFQSLFTIGNYNLWIPDQAYTVPQMWVSGRWAIRYGLNTSTDTTCYSYDGDPSNPPIAYDYQYTSNPTNTGGFTLTTPDIQPNGVVPAPAGFLFCDAIHAYENRWDVAFETNDGGDVACSLRYRNGTIQKNCAAQ